MAYKPTGTPGVGPWSLKLRRTYAYPARIVSGISHTTWVGLEVFHPGTPQARVTWAGLEVFHPGTPSARVSWVGIEVFRPITFRTRLWRGREPEEFEEASWLPKIQRRLFPFDMPTASLYSRRAPRGRAPEEEDSVPPRRRRYGLITTSPAGGDDVVCSVLW